jgi:hypothetical protein
VVRAITFARILRCDELLWIILAVSQLTGLPGLRDERGPRHSTSVKSKLARLHDGGATGIL